MWIALVLVFSGLCLAGPINWGSSVSVGTNAGWGRMLTQFRNQTASLLTYTEYDHALPIGCDPNYNQPGPKVWVTISNNNFRSYQTYSWIDSPPQHIQEQSMILQVPNSNKLLLAMRNRLPDCNWFGLPVVASNDEGKTWTFISQLDQTTKPTGKFNRGLWEPFLFALPNGCIGGFYADETYADSGYNQIVAERESCDGGATWNNRIFAVSKRDNVSRPGMPGVARLANGQVILVFEVCGSDNCNIHYKISPDGLKWADGLGTRIMSQVNGPYVQVTPTGRVLVTSACTNVISISDDNGATWYENSDPAWNNNCHSGSPFTWPAIYNTGTNQVGVAVSGLTSQIQIKFGDY